MHRNDCKFIYLRGAGYTGALNDMEYAYLVDQGATPAQLNDMWIEIWVGGGGTLADFNDMAYEFLTGLGLSGALPDMWTAFWCNFASGVPTGYTIDWSAIHYDSLTGLNSSVVIDYDPAYDTFTYDLVVSGVGSADIPLTGALDATGQLIVSGIDITVFDPGPVDVVGTITNSGLTGRPTGDRTSYTTRTPSFEADFSTYPDASLLEAHASWDVSGGVGGICLITRDLCRNNNNNEGMVSINTGIPPDITDCAVGCKLAYRATGSVSTFPIALIKDFNNMVGVRIFNNQVHLYTKVDGAWYQPIQVVWPTQIGDTMVLVVSGTTYTGFINGVQVFQTTLALDLTDHVPGVYARTTVNDMHFQFYAWDMSQPGDPAYP